MRLDRLWISEFKNLRDFTIDFDEKSQYVVLVGKNGTGKSNLIEAIVYIFQTLDLEEPAPFGYQLAYRRAVDHGKDLAIEIIAEREKQPVFHVDENEIPKSEFYSHNPDGSPKYLPRFVFGYYSGPSDRLQGYFRKHQERFYSKLKSPKATAGELPFRPLFLAQNVHGQFVLLAFYSHPDPRAQAFLRDNLRIADLEHIRFVINRPKWASRASSDRFWGTTGIPRSMLEKLEEFSIATTKSQRKIALDFRRSTTVECWNFLLNRAGFEEMATSYKSSQDLFKALESTHISNLLFEIVVDVKVENADGSISFRELSEGEQQLLLVLGLLRFTKEDEAVFLLDEPDTHLNPAWSVQYLKFVEDMVGQQQTSQIVMATHDPLVFGGLLRNQVRVMNWSSEGRVVALEPDEDPRGMGIDSILTSELFGLRAALDLPTLEEMDARRRLLVKQPKSPEEVERLRQLDERLAGLDYSIDSGDPLFPLFVEAMTRWQQDQGLLKPVLSEEELRRQREQAAEIVRKLKSGGQNG